MVRTSESHPIRVSEIACGPGLIGMTFCPGKKGVSVDGEPWDRDLETDIAALAEWRPDYVVTLMEAHEFDLLGVPGLGRAIEAAGLQWMHLPNVHVDAAAFYRRWLTHGQELKQCLWNGGRVLLHSRDGSARTGYVTAWLLLEMEMNEPDVVIEKIRASRPEAIATEEQERNIHSLDLALICQGIRDE